MLTPPRRRLLSALVALSEQAERDDLPHAAELLDMVRDAIEDGTEAEFVDALVFLAAGRVGEPYVPVKLRPSWGGDGASAGGV